jgi:hypothetical protein
VVELLTSMHEALGSTSPLKRKSQPYLYCLEIVTGSILTYLVSVLVLMVVLGIEPRASSMLHMNPHTEQHPQSPSPFICLFYFSLFRYFGGGEKLPYCT